MSAEDDKNRIAVLKHELQLLAQWPIKWTSSKAEKKIKDLVVIWEVIWDMPGPSGSGTWPEIEKLQLEILRQMSVLSNKHFKSFVAEFTQYGGISRRARAQLLAIRLRSKPDRFFEWIHPWIDNGNADRARRTQSD